jgi:hypothetical protein
MLPGFLYFDIRRGLSAEALCGAMADLVTDINPVRQIFDHLGLKDISFAVNETTAQGIKCRIVHFYVGDHLVSLEPSLASQAFCCQHELIQACMRGETISLEQVRGLFLQKKVKPTISAIAIKILEQLETQALTEHQLSGQEALWLICHVAMLVALVDTLDPKFIMASKPVIGQPKSTTISLCDPLWLNQVLLMLPVIHQQDDVCADVVAVAFIKTLAGHIGARGESTMLKVGIGHSSGCLIEALWCEAALPVSMQECGPSNNARVAWLHEVVGLTKATTDMAHLSSSLFLHGVRAMTWQLVYGDKNTAYYMTRFVCSDEDKKEAIEAFLIKGEAREVSVSTIEHHQLNRRLVSVPLGHGNKTSSVRFHEYIYYEKTVRVEPLPEDLELYVEKTQYSVDVARGDLLLAWKKWRGRVAGEI